VIRITELLEPFSRYLACERYSLQINKREDLAGKYFSAKFFD